MCLELHLALSKYRSCLEKNRKVSAVSIKLLFQIMFYHIYLISWYNFFNWLFEMVGLGKKW